MLSAADQVRLLAEDKKYGARSIGQREYRMFLKGLHLTHRQRLLALCYNCCGSYSDGHEDCGILECPAHHTMPYRNITSPGRSYAGTSSSDDGRTHVKPIHEKRDAVDGRFKARNSPRLETTTKTTQQVISHG